MQALNQAGILPLQNHSTLQLSGKQVMIGFLDTGIDYQNPVFQNLDKTTRIAGIWDQTIQSGTPPETFDYGSHYTGDMINAALATENPLALVPTVDEDGHGTFLASIAAGSGNPEAQFIGAAPEAVIAVVKLKQAKQYLRNYYFIPESAYAVQETDIMLGMRYLHLLALKMKLPLIFCFALGSNLGGHSGSLPLSITAQQYTLLSNRIPVIGVGNEADQRHHFFSGDHELFRHQNCGNTGRRKYFRIYDGALDRTSQYSFHQSDLTFRGEYLTHSHTGRNKHHLSFSV